MGIYTLLAEGLRYPRPGLAERLETASTRLPVGGMRQTYQAFVRGIQPLSLGEWEELYTRTLDLNPPVVPYVGFQIWGESYQRGAFMAQLNRELDVYGVGLEGELPDHLLPLLGYLDHAGQPLPELLEVLPVAVHKMVQVLQKAEADNPYLSLLRAIEHACQQFRTCQAQVHPQKT